MRYALIDEAYSSKGSFSTPNYPDFAVPEQRKDVTPPIEIVKAKESPLELVSSDCIKALEHLQTCIKCRKPNRGENMLLKFIIFILLIVIFFKN
jgi:hypothetical protein